MEKRRVHFASATAVDFRKNRDHPYTNKKLTFKHVYKYHTPIKSERASSSQHSGLRGSRETDIQHHKPDIIQKPFTQLGDTFDLKRHILEMIVKDLHTPRIVEEGGFQNLMNALNPSVDAALNACAIRKDLMNMYVNIKRKVKNAVKNAKDPVLSAELWISGNKESYLTVTCHFIDDMWELKSYTLETAQLLGEETSENVHLQLCRILTEWELMAKIRVVVVNLDGMKKKQINSKWMYIPCFSHILNKVILEALDSQAWGYLLKKCRHIVQFFYQEKEESWSDFLAQSACVSWLSTLNMLEKICKQWPRFSKVNSYKKAGNLWLNENERKLLKNMMEALTVVKNVTSEIAMHGYFPISNIIPLLDKLQLSLRRPIQRDNKVAFVLSERFTHHFGQIHQNTCFTFSTSLDPRFKSSVFKTDEGKKVMADLEEEMCKKGNAMSSSCQNKSLNYNVLQYVAENDMSASECPLQYWKAENKSNDLTIMAHKYLSVICTVIPIERMMHEDKSQIFFNRRKCLELKDINMMLFLNANHHKI